ncbi:MAG: hypothetical protein WCX30_00950 [Candidatus Paceibacterota bacterium]|jgi:hypothetical protein|nr:hypothetical protein [bacterium]
MKNNIFKNPSSSDLEFIEEIVTKHKLEDQFLTELEEEDRKLIEAASSIPEKAALKSFFHDIFPYTEKLWEEIFLIINNKIPLNLVALDFSKRSGLPIDTCNLIAQDLSSNPTIQKEISAIRIEEDSPTYDEYTEFPESQEDLQEIQDEEIVSEIKKKLETGEMVNPEKKSGGLGQELF